MRILPLIVVLFGMLALAGCAKKPTTPPEGETGTTIPADGGASTAGAGAGGVGEASGLPGYGAGEGEGAGEGALGADSVIFFDFDSSEIRPEFAGVISAQARRLTANPGLRMRLEGHTDERGSREYNIALGERRAQAVRRALMLQGVSDSQLITVSYGEERPAVEGTDEAAFAKNRRVEFRPAS
jgi:peptidoglycan-associated lipoprotein